MDLDAPLSWLNNIMVYQGLWKHIGLGGDYLGTSCLCWWTLPHRKFLNHTR